MTRLFENLKVGDMVFVVDQKRQYAEVRASYEKVVRVGRKLGYIERGHRETPFRLDNGISHHSESNTRVNNQGFDVFPDEATYVSKITAEKEHQRLKDRLFFHGRLTYLSPEAVEKIHEILDSEEA